jgi:outer membrane protein OmpA-like peptidoglycan-associated protein
MPPHKGKKKKQEVFERGSKEVSIDTIVYERPSNEKILALERHNLKKGQNIRIEQLYFENDSTAINIESFQVLNELFSFLNENEDIHVEIGGHTNNIPSHDYCNRLSTERAKAVAEYLVKKGIDPNRITYRGYGKRRPIATNGNEEGRKKNQRVEIKIVSIG